MNAQNEITLSFVESFEAYAADSKAMGELKSRLEDARRVLEPVIRAHKIPVDDNKAWKEKRAIFFPLVKELEWPIIDEDVIQDERLKAEKRKAEARIAAWLGVIRTCLEYQILPTDKNADRLRKARMWTALSGNGKPNPNWVDPNAPKVEEPKVEEPKVEEPKVEEPKVEEPAPAPDKAPSKPATAQKDAEATTPLHANVSGYSEAPISSQEHFASLWMQLSKNDTFKLEFVDMMAAALDVSRATLTNVMWQSAEQIIKGAK